MILSSVYLNPSIRNGILEASYLSDSANQMPIPDAKYKRNTGSRKNHVRHLPRNVYRTDVWFFDCLKKTINTGIDFRVIGALK